MRKDEQLDYEQMKQKTITVETPRDRSSTFEPELIRKRETILAESLEQKIIGMYGLG